MSTPNTKIFSKFNTTFEDSNLFSLLTDEEITELFDIFLNKTRSIHFKSCKKDLSNYESPDFYTENFVYSDSNQFTISKYPNSPNSEAITYICTVNNINAIYTFDENTLTFTITSSLEENDSIKCGYEFVGQINSDLDDEECWLCALGMRLTWLDRQIYKEEKLRDRLTTKDYNANHSNGNLLDKLVLLKNETKKELSGHLISYSFNSFEGFN